MRCKNAFLHQMHFCTALLNIFLWKMYAEHFPLENVRQNAFWHQMHFGIKCIFASNAFVTFCFAKMHFCTNKMYASLFFAKQKTQHFCTAEHFPLENVMQKCIFAQPKCILPLSNILVCKNAFDAYILLVQKCIFAKQNVTNAFLRTFSKGKCSAPTKCKGSIFVFCKAKNTAFLHQMHFCTAEHFPLENVR